MNSEFTTDALALNAKLEELQRQVRNIENALARIDPLARSYVRDPWNEGLASYGPALTSAEVDQQLQEQPFSNPNPSAFPRSIKGICGRDDRKQEMVNASSDHKRRCTCFLQIRSTDGTDWIGTGFFVAPRVVATAAHVVFDHDHGGFPQWIRVFPGANDTSGSVFGSQVATAFRVARGWVDRQSFNYDYGAIILPDRTLYNSIGQFVFSLRVFNEANGDLQTFGYPGDKPEGQQWSTPWEYHPFIIRSDANNLTHFLDAVGGQSGSPIIWNTNYDPVIAIHSFEQGDCSVPSGRNGAVWLNDDRIGHLLRDWNPER